MATKMSIATQILPWPCARQGVLTARPGFQTQVTSGSACSVSACTVLGTVLPRCFREHQQNEVCFKLAKCTSSDEDLALGTHVPDSHAGIAVGRRSENGGGRASSWKDHRHPHF